MEVMTKRLIVISSTLLTALFAVCVTWFSVGVDTDHPAPPAVAFIATIPFVVAVIAGICVLIGFVISLLAEAWKWASKE